MEGVSESFTNWLATFVLDAAEDRDWTTPLLGSIVVGIGKL